MLWVRSSELDLENEQGMSLLHKALVGVAALAVMSVLSVPARSIAGPALPSLLTPMAVHAQQAVCGDGDACFFTEADFGGDVTSTRHCGEVDLGDAGVASWVNNTDSLVAVLDDEGDELWVEDPNTSGPSVDTDLGSRATSALVVCQPAS